MATLSPYRLPVDVVPDNYKISLDIDKANQRVSGSETISVRVLRPVDTIRLNALGLTIKSADVRVGEETITVTVSEDTKYEMISLEAAETIPAGEASITISFEGELTEGLRGLYLSRTNGQVLAATQMQGTYARMLFPSFDEPDFKATFDLDLTIDKDDVAISNGPLLREKNISPDRKHLVFGTSPKMSTYLVAMAIGRFECIEATIDDTPIRVCARPEVIEQTRFAMEVTKSFLEYYNEWYGIDYPFEKLDLVAIPDYEWGGMENTASIFFRESSLLVDEATTSPAKRRRVAGLVSHEIAHMWFGDLVTATWWDDIWLNEGFASWITPKPVAAMNADWDRPESAVATAQRIIDLDSLESTRPIHGVAASPGEIKEMFDGIAYSKGASVILMLESFVGEENFRKGVNSYLEKFANGNATSEDLWNAIGKVSGESVEAIMPTFVKQPGVPVVSIDLSEREGRSVVTLAQQRFLLGGSEKSDLLWQIPVCLRFANTDGTVHERCELIKGATHEITVDGTLQWLHGNADGKGYYRVAYTASLLEALGESAETLNPSERLALLRDTWAMVRAGRSDVASFLSLVEAMRGEENRFVIESMLGPLSYVKRSLASDEETEKFQTWVASQFVDLTESLGWEPLESDEDDTKSLRATLFGVLVSAGDKEATAKATALVEAYLDDPASVDPSLAGVAFDRVPAWGDVGLFDSIEKAAKTTESNEAYSHYIYALPNFSEPELVDRALAFSESGALRLDRFPTYFEMLVQNRAAQRAGWDYMKSNWDDLKTKVISFGGRGAMRGLGAICSSELRDDIATFFEKNDAPGAERALEQSLEQMDLCIAFRKTQRASFEKWLEEN